MSTQISITLPDEMYDKTQDYVEKHGFESTQDFIREMIRRTIYEKDHKIWDHLKKKRRKT